MGFFELQFARVSPFSRDQSMLQAASGSSSNSAIRVSKSGTGASPVSARYATHFRLVLESKSARAQRLFGHNTIQSLRSSDAGRVRPTGIGTCLMGEGAHATKELQYQTS
jgi:hypothetical protein